MSACSYLPRQVCFIVFYIYLVRTQYFINFFTKILKFYFILFLICFKSEVSFYIDNLPLCKLNQCVIFYFFIETYNISYSKECDIATLQFIMDLLVHLNYNNLQLWVQVKKKRTAVQILIVLYLIHLGTRLGKNIIFITFFLIIIYYGKKYVQSDLLIFN